MKLLVLDSSGLVASVALIEEMCIRDSCKNISERPVQTFHEAVQSTWFLFVILQMESNASSFSPGRLCLAYAIT